MTLKVGSLGGWWHAAHILLSVLTGGLWLVVYGAHALISAVSRPTVVVEVPPGHRVEYYRGYPNVLGPDEYLDKPRPSKPLLIAFLLACAFLASGIAYWMWG